MAEKVSFDVTGRCVLRILIIGNKELQVDGWLPAWRATVWLECSE